MISQRKCPGYVGPSEDMSGWQTLAGHLSVWQLQASTRSGHKHMEHVVDYNTNVHKPATCWSAMVGSRPERPTTTACWHGSSRVSQTFFPGAAVEAPSLAPHRHVQAIMSYLWLLYHQYGLTSSTQSGQWLISVTSNLADWYAPGL